MEPGSKEDEWRIPELHDTEEFLEFIGSKWNVGEKWAEYLDLVYQGELPHIEEIDTEDWASLIHEAIYCSSMASVSVALSQHVNNYGYPWSEEGFWEHWDTDQMITQIVSGILYSLGSLTSVIMTVITVEEATCEDLLIELAMAADENVFSEADVNWPTIGAFVGTFLSGEKNRIPSLQDFLALLNELKGESE